MNNNSACQCTSCTCGISCKCTEELCRCEASQIIESTSGIVPKGGTAAAEPPRIVRAPPGAPSVVTLSITGMSCSHCSNTIEKALTDRDGILNAKVDLISETARVEYEGKKVSVSQMIGLIESIGFEATTTAGLVDATTQQEQKSFFQISGMTCSMCSQAIQRALSGIPGVIQANVDLSQDTATVTHLPTVDAASLQEVIESIGYTVERCYTDLPTPHDEVRDGSDRDPDNPAVASWDRLVERQARKVRQRRNAFLGSLLGAAPILFITMILPLFSVHVNKTWHGISLEFCILFALATPVQFIAGWEFYRMTYYNLKNRSAGMDVLVSLGTTASYVYAIAFQIPHFFETSAVLICFVLLGKYLQAVAVRQTSRALQQLMQLQPTEAIVLDGATEKRVPISQVKRNDIVKVLQGSSIPADGTLVENEMSVDESMITGESLPVLKTVGSPVLGGTLCVETGSSGAGLICVTGVGSDTALSKIVQLVQEAQTRRVPIQSFADKVSSIFVPTVCLISLVTFLSWFTLVKSGTIPQEWYEGESPATFSIQFAIAVLVISCPCALGLATPTAVMVGTSVGARHGILIKSGEALEVASKVDAIVFDKTGTLTLGKPSITDFISNFHEDNTNLLLWQLATLERNSEHPLARAICEYAEDKLGDYILEHPLGQTTDFRNVTGRGAVAVINGFIVGVGNRSFARQVDVLIDAETEDQMKQLEEEGKTAVFASVDGTVSAVIGLADQLKPDAKASLSFLSRMNIDVWMVTGDNRRTAKAIGEKLGLNRDKIISEALPSAKLAHVQALQEQGLCVAMVGDGVNDSPALVQADVGIGVGSGTEIATEAADMVLVKGNVRDVCTAFDLSRNIFSRIRMNFVWSLLYNCLGIPVASGVLYPWIHARLPPTLAAVCMALSSVSVVLSSLSLNLYRPKKPRHRFQLPEDSSPLREFHRDEDTRVNLLQHDYMAASELTIPTDNRSNAV